MTFVEEHPESLNPIITETERLLKNLHAIRTAHGDMKATNLWWHNSRIYLLDLDATRDYHSPKALTLALANDQKRFEKNWGSRSHSV